MAESNHPVLEALMQAFNAVRDTLLPSEGRKFTMRWHSSLPSVYESSVKALGGKPDAETSDALTEIAGSYIDALESRTTAQLQHLLHGDALSEKIGGDKAIEEKIPEVLDKATYELHTIVDTEVQRARAVGALEGINQVAASVGDNDPTVFFVIVRDNKVCDTCLSLHMLPDGVTPRVWKLSECSTDYHKKGENFPSMWGEHPHCFTENMRLHTSAGTKTFKELFESQEHLDVVVDSRVMQFREGGNQFGKLIPGMARYNRHGSGTELKHATSVFDTGIRKCYRVTLASGHQIEVSEDHDMWVDDGSRGYKVAAKDLKVGDNVPLVSGTTPFGTASFPVLAELMGNLLGDGTLADTAVWHFFGEEIEYGLRLYESAQNIMPHGWQKGRPSVNPPDEKYQVPHMQFGSTYLSTVMREQYCLSKKPRCVPNAIWSADKQTIAAFLRGLFSADGHAEKNAVVFAQNDIEFMREIQLLLSQFGIISRIFKHGDEEDKIITYANGRKFITHRKACWRLGLTGYETAKKFAEEIGFGPKHKQERLLELLTPNKGGKKYRTARVVNIEDIGLRQTYSVTEHLTNTVTVNGVVTGNCRCGKTYLPPGFGFNKAGRVTWIKKDYDEYKVQRGLE